MQGSDETNHFLRAYQVSEGHVVASYIGKSEGGITSRPLMYKHNVGGNLPSGIVNFTFEALDNIPQDTAQKMTAAEFSKLSAIQTGSGSKGAAFGNTVAYSPVMYVPQSLAILLGRLFHARPIVLFYMARLAALLFGVTVLAWAIRLMPFGKLPITIILLLPTSIGQLSTINEDTVTISLIFFTMALLLRYAYRKQNLKTREISYIIGLFALIGFVKPVFLPMTIIVLLLLRNKFIPRKRTLITTGICIAVALSCALAWNLAVKNMSIYGDHLTYLTNNYQLQLKFIEHHPLKYLHVLGDTVLTGNFNYVPIDLIGYMGWADTPLPILAVAYGFVLISMSFFVSSQYEAVTIRRSARTLAAISLIGVALLTCTSLYLILNAPGDPSIAGIQGRYFTPSLVLLPLVFLGGKRFIEAAQYNIYVRRCLSASVVLLIIMLCVTFSRFYNVAAII
jgi:uncharacterized membrane protein